jgi:flavin-dependent dehydrogenase
VVFRLAAQSAPGRCIHDRCRPPPPRSSSYTAFWSKHLERTTHTRTRAREFHLENFCVRAANSYHMDSVVGSDWLAVGDAATAFDPLSSEGICKALQSGLRAAQAIHEYLGGGGRVTMEKYAADIAKQVDVYMAKRVEYYSKEQRWPDSVFWRRRRIWDRSMRLSLQGLRGKPSSRPVDTRRPPRTR